MALSQAKDNMSIRRLFFLTIHLVVCLEVNAQLGDATVWKYINTYKEMALEQERLYGVPATITLAQGIVETGAGTSRLAREARNHFGIKAHNDWKGPVYKAKDDEIGLSSFRQYNSAQESFTDHSRFLKRHARYRSLFSLNILNYRDWAQGLQDAYYASSPVYAQTLIQYIEKFQLYKINGGVKIRPRSRQTVVHRKRIIYVTVLDTIPGMDFIADDELTEEEETYDEVMRLPYVAKINGVRCKRLYPGESLSSIAMENDISKYDLLDYNEAPNEDTFKEGDIIYLAKKKNKFKGSQDYYTVDDGDTWHSISQLFGVNFSYLLKKNNRSYSDNPVVGERLRLK